MRTLFSILLYTFFFFFSAPCCLIAQKSVFGQKPKAKTFGKLPEGTARQCVRNGEGNLVIVGAAGPFSQTGLDVRFTILTMEGDVVMETKIGVGNGDDVANSITPTLDGGYIIVGYTTTKRQGSVGKRDAWLIKTDEKGTTLWETTFGTPNDDELTDVVEDDNGNLWLSGTKNDKIWLIQTEAEGQFILEKTFGKGKAAANDLILLPTGVALTGFDTSGDTQQLITLSFDKTGNLLWESLLPNACGKAIIRTAKGALAIAGTAYNRPTLDDALLVKMDFLTGKILETHTYGGKSLDEDGANTLVEDFDGQIFLAGYTKSYPVGSRRQQYFLVKTDSVGKELGRYHEKSAQNGFAEKAFLTDRGNLMTIGSKNGKTWLHRFGQVCLPRKPKQVVELAISEEKWVDDDGILKPKERSYYEFWIENKSTETLYQPQIEVVKQGTIGDKILFNKRTIPIDRLLAGERRKITIPFSIPDFDDTKNDATAHFEVTIKALGDIVAPKWTFAVPYAVAPRANIAVTDHRFLKDERQNSPKKTYVFIMDIENTGDLDLPILRVDFALPPKLHPLSNSHLQVIFPMKSKQTLRFEFEVDTSFEETTLSLQCAIHDDEGEVNINKDFVMRY